MALAKIAQETFESEDKLADILLNFDHNMDDDKKDHKILFEPLIEILENPEFSEKKSNEKSDNEDEIKGEDSEEDDEIEAEKSEKDEEVSGHIEGEGEVTVQIGDQSPITKEYSFNLPLIPGSESQDDIVVEEEQKVDDDVWHWKLDSFFPWLDKMNQNWPKHSGYDVSGLERMISYGKALLKEISTAAKQDIRGILDIKLLEKARNSIMNAVERGEDRLEKLLQSLKPKKKKAFETESGLIKEARAGRGAGNFVVTIPCLISGVARICINSTVSAGKDIEDTFHKMAKKLKLDEREIFQLAMVIEDMGYPLRRDRGILLNEEFDPTSSENFDYMPNYPA